MNIESAVRAIKSDVPLPRRVGGQSCPRPVEPPVSEPCRGEICLAANAGSLDWMLGISAHWPV